MASCTHIDDRILTTHWRDAFPNVVRCREIIRNVVVGNTFSMEFIIYAVESRLIRIEARHHDIDIRPIPFVVVFKMIEEIKK